VTGGSNVFAILRRVAAQFFACSPLSVTDIALLPLLASHARLGAAGKLTWPSWIEYDLVETNSERNGGYCNVHYGETNHQTGPHNFSGDLTQWHVYGCELHPQGVAFYLDGKITKQLAGEYVRSKYPHRLGIQLDVDRTGRTGPDTDMLIDWVRVAKFK
jgi:hypothetical protein